MGQHDRPHHDRYQEQLTDAIDDGGGCTETWETLSEQRRQRKETPTDRQQDVAETLVEIGCLRPGNDGEELELRSSFRTDWREAIDALTETEPEARLEELLEVDGPLEITEAERVRVSQDGTTIGTWVSRPALLADLAALQVLETSDEAWADRSVQARSQLAAGMRLYLESCPACEGDTDFTTAASSSCCGGEYTVAKLTCASCDRLLFRTAIRDE